METRTRAFWHFSAEDLFKELNTTPSGLSQAEAEIRLKQCGPNLLRPKKNYTIFSLFVSQFTSPLVLLLLFAALLSLILYDRADAAIILGIVVASGILGFIQEKGASDVVARLLAIVEVRSQVLRDGKEVDVKVEAVVPGDILILNAGDLIPGDCFILESRDLFVDEATLTGEAFAIEKKEGVLPEGTPLNKRTNILYMSSNIVSGTAKAVVVRTGKDTIFGQISEHLKTRPPETAFQTGIRKFGLFLMGLTLVLTTLIFLLNAFFDRPLLESFLFAVALAVGLTPQLLPAIITVNLAHGAKRMAQADVIVKRLASIENFGSMNILCTDKTGTLTKGIVELSKTIDFAGCLAEKGEFYACLNAALQSGYTNPIDQALIYSSCASATHSWSKCDEIPYDFSRKRITILAKNPEGQHFISCKGAIPQILAICTKAELASGKQTPIEEVRSQIDSAFSKVLEEGYRALGIAYAPFDKDTLAHSDEKELIFLGFILFLDPLKDDIVETVARFQSLGVQVKVLTGDHHLVACSVAKKIGLNTVGIAIGGELQEMNEEAFLKEIAEKNVFAEVEPAQKERIILALRKAGHIVGYLGDGVNDAMALHAADVSISVNSAADVDKHIADIVLLKKDLAVLASGVEEGRRTFANSMKYIFMATSANFGNMFSMAGASLILPFLPLLPKQILLTNLLTDCPEMMIATDQVDKQMVTAPLKWDIRFIRKFMIVFGLISSIFDYATFGILLFLLRADTLEFRTGWFVESVVSASFITLVIRTRAPFYKSRPSLYLLSAVLLIGALTCILPYTPLASLLGFTPLPPFFLLALVGIMFFYILFVEIAKKLFYSKVQS